MGLLDSSKCGGGGGGGGCGGGGKVLLLQAVRLAGVEDARGVLEDKVAVGGGGGVRAERASSALLLPREVERGGA